ncbi:alpha/beta hydrolase, partial [Burkholderia cenocepacia]
MGIRLHAFQGHVTRYPSSSYARKSRGLGVLRAVVTRPRRIAGARDRPAATGCPRASPITVIAMLSICKMLSVARAAVLGASAA